MGEGILVYTPNSVHVLRRVAHLLLGLVPTGFLAESDLDAVSHISDFGGWVHQSFELLKIFLFDGIESFQGFRIFDHFRHPFLSSFLGGRL